MDEAVSNFSGITGATAQVARHFLNITDGDTEQAIQLFFDSPDLSSALAQEISTPPPVPPASTRPPPRAAEAPRSNAAEVIEIDSDDDHDMSLGDEDEDTFENSSASVPQAMSSHPGAYEDDEAMARRMQEEFYAGGDMAGEYGGQDVRAPLARTTETLVGPSSDWSGDDMQAAVLQQLRTRTQTRSRLGAPGVFNQQTPSSSIWDESDPIAHRESLAQATGGASEASSKAARLAELFRPPFELISRLSWDEAREKGKDEEKWILVNVQDPSIFDCQALNRDIWKHDGIKETVQENFIFMQYSKDDPRGSQYIQYYFNQFRDDSSAYPHIAIVDPRTGEQLKVWSGPHPPKAMDFLMQLHEFLDRYSLNVAVKNPVAKRKAEKPVIMDVDKLTEEQMLDLALQNSLANGNDTRPKEPDPDDLTRSVGDLTKGKGKMVKEDEDMDIEEVGSNGNNAETAAVSPFANISSNHPHAEPANDPTSTTRIQFRHSSGRIIRRFSMADPVQRIYEWLKASPLEGKVGVEFELKSMGRDLIDSIEVSIADAGLKNGTVMIEYLED